MRIIVDAFGGDNAPLEIIRGAAQAANEYGVGIILTGSESIIRRVAAEDGIDLNGISIVDAPDVISMEDEPRSILKEHKDCSMAEGLRRLAAGEGDAFVSAGSTGALIMGGTFIVKRIKGVSRAALAVLMPGDKGPFMLLDVGANADSRPEMLLQFAHMGSIYMSSIMGEGKPVTVGLVNVGTEDTKGGELQHAAFALMKESGLNFAGNIEARDIPLGVVDVAVADGFTGNVILKLTEGVADVLLKNIKSVFLTNAVTKLAGLIIKPYLKGLKKKMDTSEYGGAPLLGLSKPVIKTHGNSKAAAVKNAIRVAAEFAEKGVIEQISMAVKATSETGE
ncbi:MAG: phosphate acyltransferase PlsX [Oscillospiraceae bacterium]|nr:phosphate acyltransferase PlsX [Oscillospiraceae bacterium]MDD4413490.1 phosphate acyltransferase PlsX [Oscillospiraceae bacterium]